MAPPVHIAEIVSVSTSPSIDIWGIHLAGVPAAVAFLVSLISVCRAAIDFSSWLRHKLIPIKLEAFAWDGNTDSLNTQEWPTQLQINVHNGNDQARDLLRFEVLYDPGWWGRLKLWRKNGADSPGLQIKLAEKKQLPVGWSTIFPVAIHAKPEHKNLLVTAGFAMKHARTVRAKKQETPIYVPHDDPVKTESE